MKRLLSSLAVVAASQAHATLLTIDDTWTIQKNAAATISDVTATGGTSASLSYGYASTASGTGSPGGVTNNLAIGQLGSTVGDSILLSFSVSVTSPNPLSLNRAFSFGLADADGKGLINQVSIYTGGTAISGSNVNLNYRDTGVNGDIFRGAASGTQVTTPVAPTVPGDNFFPTTVGELESNYVFSITRTLAGAIVSLSSTSGSETYTSNILSLTTAEIDAISFDTVLFGFRNGYIVDSSSWSISNIEVAVNTAAIPEPHVNALLLIAAVVGGFAIHRKRARAHQP